MAAMRRGPRPRRMTGLEFEAVRPLLKISGDRISAARLALVDGQTLQAVGEQFGWSRQAVGDAVRIVWQALERWRQSQCAAASAGALLPPGWEQVTLIAPRHLIARLRSEIAHAWPQPVKKAAKAVKKTPKEKPGGVGSGLEKQCRNP